MVNIKPINKAIVMLTTSCTLACPYCFESHNPKHMTLETAKQTMDFLQSNCQDDDIVRFTFFGGEPMIMYDKLIVPLIEYSKGLPHPTQFSMTTNGTLFTPERLQYLKDNNCRFMLSFDGIRQVQEENRPMKLSTKSSYDEVMKSWQDIQNSGIDYSLRGTLTSYSLPWMMETILFFDSLGCPTYHLLPNLWENWGEFQQKIFAEQLAEYEEYIIDSFRKNKMPLLFTDYTASFWRIVASQNVPQIARRTIHALTPEARCGMGVRGSCSINPDGDMFGCHHITPMERDSIWYIGNVYDGIDEERIQNLISLYEPQKLGNSHCSGCPLDGICDGGCTPTNYMVTGDVNQVPETYCIWTRGITDSAYRVASILGKEENELFRRTFLRWCKK